MRCLTVWALFVLMLGLVQARAEGGTTIGLVGHWELDGNGLASNGRGPDGTIHGTATPAEDRFGRPNHALSFDRDSGYGYVSIADHVDLRPANAITFTAWFMPTWFDLGSYSWPAVLKKSTPGQNDGYALETLWVMEGTPEMGASLVLPSAQPAQAHLPIATDKWYFGAAVYDGSNVSLYLGQSDLRPLAVNSLSGSGSINHSLGELWIGADPSNEGPARSFNGVIDDVRIYDRALSAGEIQELYTVPEPSTIILLGAGVASALAFGRRREASAPGR